jgi:hypothetical protein
MPRLNDRVEHRSIPRWEQLEIPFLTPERAATVDAARAAVARAEGNALAGRRLVEADELHRLGEQLVAILEDNARAVRGEQ